MPTLAVVANSVETLVGFRLPVMTAMITAGWRVIALSPNGRYTARLRAAGIEHRLLDIDRWDVHPVRETRAIVGLARQLRALRPDLIHAFMGKPTIHAGVAARWLPRVPVIGSITGLGSVYADAESPFAPMLLDRLYRFACRRVTRVVFQNPDDRRHFLERGLIRSDQARIIRGSGVDLSRFRPIDRRGRAGCTVTMVARVIASKGVREFAAAAGHLRRLFGTRVRCLLAGDLDTGNPAGIILPPQTAASASSPLSWLGYRDEIPALLDETDIYCLPSYREGLPVSTLEAMAAGLPVVTCDVPGCRETVWHERNGLLVPPRQVEPLVGALARLIEDPCRRRDFGAVSRLRAEREFALSNVVLAHLSLYHEVMARN